MFKRPRAKAIEGLLLLMLLNLSAFMASADQSTFVASQTSYHDQGLFSYIERTSSGATLVCTTLSNAVPKVLFAVSIERGTCPPAQLQDKVVVARTTGDFVGYDLSGKILFKWRPPNPDGAVTQLGRLDDHTVFALFTEFRSYRELAVQEVVVISCDGSPRVLERVPVRTFGQVFQKDRNSLVICGKRRCEIVHLSR